MYLPTGNNQPSLQNSKAEALTEFRKLNFKDGTFFFRQTEDGGLGVQQFIGHLK